MNRRFGREGAAAVEFALMTPFLVLLTMGIADFSAAAYTLMEVKAAAHAGVMYAYANPTSTGTTCTTGITTAEGAATSLGNTLTTTATGATAGSPTAAAPSCTYSGCPSTSGVIAATGSTCTAGDSPGTYAVAYAKATFTTMLPWAAFSLPTSMSATAIMRYK